VISSRLAIFLSGPPLSRLEDLLAIDFVMGMDQFNFSVTPASLGVTFVAGASSTGPSLRSPNPRIAR
jgi:hypothetical protein